MIPESNETSTAVPVPVCGPQPGSYSDSSAPHTSLDTNWYAVYTCTRHEKRVKQLLDERHIDCFLPLYRSVRRWKDRRKELELALFPAYVFVHINSKDRVRVLQLPSVVSFVTFGNGPAAIASSEIARAKLSQHGCVHCTRAVNPGEPPRGGRWPGFEKVECGLHNLSWHGKSAGTGDLLPEIPKPPT